MRSAADASEPAFTTPRDGRPTFLQLKCCFSRFAFCCCCVVRPSSLVADPLRRLSRRNAHRAPLHPDWPVGSNRVGRARYAASCHHVLRKPSRSPQPLVTCTCHNEVSDATYATIGWIELSKGYAWLEATEVKMAIGMLLIAELIADKAPARPSVNVSSKLGWDVCIEMKIVAPMPRAPIVTVLSCKPVRPHLPSDSGSGLVPPSDCYAAACRRWRARHRHARGELWQQSRFCPKLL